MIAYYSCKGSSSGNSWQLHGKKWLAAVVGVAMILACGWHGGNGVSR